MAARGKKQKKEPAGMNCAEIFAALALLEKERGIPQSFMMDKIIQALTTAYKRDHSDVENVIVDVDEEHQTLKMYVQKTGRGGLRGSRQRDDPGGGQGPLRQV